MCFLVLNRIVYKKKNYSPAISWVMAQQVKQDTALSTDPERSPDVSMSVTRRVKDTRYAHRSTQEHMHVHTVDTISVDVSAMMCIHREDWLHTKLTPTVTFNREDWYSFVCLLQFVCTVQTHSELPASASPELGLHMCHHI